MPDLPAFPTRRQCPFEPPPLYEEVRAESPIHRVSLLDGGTGWIVTGHRYAREILAHPHASKNGLRPGYPPLVENQVDVVKSQRGFLIWMDPPEHGRYRRLLADEFTIRRTEGLRGHIQSIVDGLIDKILEGPRPFDLVQALSLPVPTHTICELFGVPYADREVFHKATSTTVDFTTTPEERRDAAITIRSFIYSLLAEKRANPQDDLISRMIIKDDEAGGSDEELLAGLIFNLLAGGHVTTSSMISFGTLALLRNPEQLALLKQDPSLSKGAVEELLRYISVADPVTDRVAVEDIELGGVLIKAGEGIAVPNSAANHDPAAWDSPGELNIRRDANLHLAFGNGIHQCLGQHLSRVELDVVYPTLFRRIPTLRLAVPFEDLPIYYDSVFFGIHELPVTWD